MKALARLWILCILSAILFVVAVPNSSTIAQENAPDATVAALQTQVAVLSTQVASLAPEQTPAPDPARDPDVVLYEADWLEGLGGWFGTQDWQVSDGLLVNDGSNQRGEITAPFRPETDFFAVEAEIQMLSLPEIVNRDGGNYKDAEGDYRQCDDEPKFRLFVDNQGGETNAATAGVRFAECPVGNSLAYLLGDGDEETARPFNPSENWRTYRVEIRGEEVHYLIDGGLVAEEQLYRDAGRTSTDPEYILGIRDSLVGLNVRNFRVITLDGEATE